MYNAANTHAKGNDKRVEAKKVNLVKGNWGVDVKSHQLTDACAPSGIS